MTEEQIIELAKKDGAQEVPLSGVYTFSLPALTAFIDSIKELCALEAEKEVTMEGYEEEIDYYIRKL